MSQLGDGGERRAVVSLLAWQHQWYQGAFITTEKNENHGRILVLYEFDGPDHYGSDVFLYADHDYLYMEHIGSQIGSDKDWRAAEVAAIQREFGIAPG